jgi:hypothetical protein
MNPSALADRHHKLLGIYLNDHLMGAAGGGELARRCLRNNKGTPLGAALAELLSEIVEDRAQLERLMARLDVQPDRLKPLAGVVGERAGRIKLNGSLLRYSDLSRLVELEALTAGVHLKQRMWVVLRDILASDARLHDIDFDRLLQRAESQLERLENHRRQAARRAFGERTDPQQATP